MRVDLGVRFSAVTNQARYVIGVLPGRDRALRGEYAALSANTDHVGFDDTAVDHDSLRADKLVVRLTEEGAAQRKAILDQRDKLLKKGKANT